jgi:stearoyl-CoA desaturase (delta-9 desaturase)
VRSVIMRESTVLPVADPVAEFPPHGETPERLSLDMWLANLLAVIVPFLGLVCALVFLWGRGFNWVDLGLLLGMSALTGLGITVGYHRLFTHRSFESNRVVRFLLGVFGSMAVEGPLLKWVAVHRYHHQHSDLPNDPHSPHHQGRGVLGLLRGVWHAHLGWLFDPDPPDLDRYVKDLRQSGMLCTVSALFPLWATIGLLIPAVLGGLLTGTWTGVLFGLIWGGLARIFLVHHVTWSINSVCHLWGRQPYRSNDQSRDNFVVGVLGLGEGWHNTHHAFPTSARHGLRWWQIDVSYWVIRALALVGLAWNVKVPGKQAQAAQRARGNELEMGEHSAEWTQRAPDSGSLAWPSERRLLNDLPTPIHSEKDDGNSNHTHGPRYL